MSIPTTELSQPNAILAATYAKGYPVAFNPQQLGTVPKAVMNLTPRALDANALLRDNRAFTSTMR